MPFEPPRLPLYAQVEEAIAADVMSGRHRPGDRLPSEDALIEQFEVSRITVRRAMANLAARGLVEIRRGSGTFVAEPRIEHPLTELRGFVEDMQAAGLEASARVIGTESVGATREVATALRLNLGAPVTAIERVRLANGRPVSFDQTFLPGDLGARIADDDLEREPVFTLLEQKYGVPLVDAVYRLEAMAADTHVAAMLEIPEGSAIFRIERTSFTEGEVPVDFEKLHYRGDAVAFVTRLQRKSGAQQ